MKSFTAPPKVVPLNVTYSKHIHKNCYGLKYIYYLFFYKNHSGFIHFGNISPGTVTVAWLYLKNRFKKKNNEC